MFPNAFSDFVQATATKLGMTGVAAGVWVDGRETYACHGVTSAENPLPADEQTLYLIGSVSKTVTATALARLVDEGRVDLDAPVRRYVPEFALADEQAAARITVLHLLNHTSGLDWGFVLDTGEGEDAVARYVAKLPELKLLTAPGARASYSQAGYILAGRVLEKVTGRSFERAVASLVLEPVGLAHSFYERDDVMTRRFAVGHNVGPDGALSIGRLWRRPRGDNPGGGLASSAADQLRWARFHLGDGRTESGERVLSSDMLRRMHEPTTVLRASKLGDAIGVGWFVRDVDGVRTVGHGGSANGQFAELLLVPERSFAVVSLANTGPDGIPYNQAVVRWALETCLGVKDRDPKPLPLDEARARELVGRYANEVITVTVDTTERGLRLEARIKPEIRAAATREVPPDHAPFDFGLLPGAGDEYIITGGAFEGQRGFFTRDATGRVVGIDLAGRLATRVGGE
jgi:CubicO group peptidase (beta-lactamase class C family)